MKAEFEIVREYSRTYSVEVQCQNFHQMIGSKSDFISTNLENGSSQKTALCGSSRSKMTKCIVRAVNSLSVPSTLADSAMVQSAKLTQIQQDTNKMLKNELKFQIFHFSLFFSDDILSNLS